MCLCQVVEIVLGLAAIGLAIPTIVLARQNYRDCYDSLVAGGSSCNLYDRLNTYSHTSQGIWEGVLVSAGIYFDCCLFENDKTLYIYHFRQDHHLCSYLDRLHQSLQLENGNIN